MAPRDLLTNFRDSISHRAHVTMPPNHYTELRRTQVRLSIVLRGRNKAPYRPAASFP